MKETAAYIHGEEFESEVRWGSVEEVLLPVLWGIDFIREKQWLWRTVHWV